MKTEGLLLNKQTQEQIVVSKLTRHQAWMTSTPSYRQLLLDSPSQIQPDQPNSRRRSNIASEQMIIVGFTHTHTYGDKWTLNHSSMTKLLSFYLSVSMKMSYLNWWCVHTGRGEKILDASDAAGSTRVEKSVFTPDASDASGAES